MKRENRCFANPFVEVGIGPARTVPRMAVGVAVLLVGMATISAPPRAAATPTVAHAALLPTRVTIYLYDANHNPVPAPRASLTEGGVYTDTNFVGTINEENNVVDAANNVVGYVVYTDLG